MKNLSIRNRFCSGSCIDIVIFNLKEAIDLTFALLKTGGFVRHVVLETISKALLRCLENAIDSCHDIVRYAYDEY